jgi:peptide/nickel transport system substrate-binding protein
VGQNRESFETLIEGYADRRVSRRQFFARTAALGISASAAANVLAAAGPVAAALAAPTVKRGGTFIEGYDRDFAKMDTVLTTWDDPTMVALYEFTVIRDAQGKFVPDLFASWKVSKNLLTWTFKLRPGLRFHTGAPVTADMVAANFNAFRNPKVGQNAIFWPSVKGVVAQGPTTVVVTMSKPFTAFPETLATEAAMIQNLATRKQKPKAYGVSVVDGTGPFALTSYQPGIKVDVKRWDKYPGSGVPYVKNKGTAYLDGVRWVPILEVGQRANELESGSVMAVKNPAPQDVERLKGNPDIVVVEFPALAGYWISPNHQATNLGFDDVRVRQAMSHAIDRPGLVKALFFGHAAADYGPIAPNWKWYDKRVEQYNQYDPDKAKSLLDAAGWKVGSDGVRAKNGNKLSWTHIGDAGQPDTAGIDVAVAAMLQKIGMDMKVKALPAAQWGSTVTGKTPPASWGFEWLWSSPMDLLVFFYAYPSDKYNGALPAIHAAVKAWQTAPSDAKLKAAAQAMQVAWAQFLPKVPIMTRNDVYAFNKKVMGYQPLQSMLYPLYNDVWINA